MYSLKYDFNDIKIKMFMASNKFLSFKTIYSNKGYVCRVEGLKLGGCICRNFSMGGGGA